MLTHSKPKRSTKPSLTTTTKHKPLHSKPKRSQIRSQSTSTTTSTNDSTSSTTTTTTTESTTPRRKRQTLTQSTNVKDHTPISISPHGVIARDFIRESLYSKQGYFNASRVINSPGVINFSQLLGKAAYENRLKELYFSGIQGWSTPVEIFQPFYAQSLARYFISHVISTVNNNSLIKRDQLTQFLSKNNINQDNKNTSQENVDYLHVQDGLTILEDSYSRIYGVGLNQPDFSQPINNTKVSIVEIGGGNGTCASNILSFLQDYYPNVYKSTSYTIFEMSETLSWQQRELLDSNHAGKYKVHTKNAAEIDYTTLPTNLKLHHQIPLTPAEEEEQLKLTQQQQRPQLIDNRPTGNTQRTQPAALNINQNNNSNTTTKNNEHAFIFGLEVLDNMVHDKIIKGKDGQWYQIMVADKTAVEQVKMKAQVDPTYEYQFPLYDHPKDSLQKNINKLRRINDTYDNNKVTNVKKINATTLAGYMSNSVIPFTTALLNVNPKSTYHEYVMPIYDPVIEECTQLYQSYLSSPNYNPTIQSIQQSESQSEHSTKKGFFGWLTKHILQKNLSYNDEVIYLPTELLRFIHRINILYPSHTLLLADFDILPTTESVRARNAPVVAHKANESQLRGQTKDETSYLVELGLCDIFFPTDFHFVKHMYTQVCLSNRRSATTNTIKQHLSPLQQYPLYDDNVRMQLLGTDNDTIYDSHTITKSPLFQLPLSASIITKILSKPTPIQDSTITLSQEHFLTSFAEVTKTECKNGFNPMLSDYNNMAMFIGQRQ